MGWSFYEDHEDPDHTVYADYRYANGRMKMWRLGRGTVEEITSAVLPAGTAPSAVDTLGELERPDAGGIEPFDENPANRVIQFGGIIYAAHDGQVYRYDDDSGWLPVSELPDGLVLTEGGALRVELPGAP